MQVFQLLYAAVQETYNQVVSAQAADEALKKAM